jgi:hypothetical protein
MAKIKTISVDVVDDSYPHLEVDEVDNSMPEFKFVRLKKGVALFSRWDHEFFANHEEAWTDLTSGKRILLPKEVAESISEFVEVIK